jgi:hypothetical protein
MTDGSTGGEMPPNPPPSEGEMPPSATPTPPATVGETPPEPEETEDEQRRDAELPVEQLRKALDAERRQRRAAEREVKRHADAAKAQADAEKTELERMTERATLAEAKIADYEREVLARQIAAEAGIPEWWDRLSGEDVRSLRADAQKVRERLGYGSGALDGGVRGSGVVQREPSMDDLIRSGARR